MESLSEVGWTSLELEETVRQIPNVPFGHWEVDQGGHDGVRVS